MFARSRRWIFCLAIGMTMATRMLTAAAPPNDSFANATELFCATEYQNSVKFYGTTVGATSEVGEGNNSDLAIRNSRGTVWWKWTCTNWGYVTISAATRYAYITGGLFTGPSICNLITQAISPNGRVRFSDSLPLSEAIWIYRARILD